MSVISESRGRPLSGVWSLLTWLRREDRASSEDSLSSGATSASFAYLRPAGYPSAAPATRLHPSPPSETYRKRVHAGECRRKYEQGLTLHRKYLLPLGEVQYDALTLPTSRIDQSSDRDRRATSESLPRRLAHVPGKRRAPPPPRAVSTLRRTNKRPAPQPPLVDNRRHSSEVRNIDKENLQMSYKLEATIDKPAHKSARKESSIKPRQEKSFLKQIFENRKRNSAIDVPPVKLLPSISELDKQAAELLKSYKLKVFEQNNNVASPGTSSNDMGSNDVGAGDMWFCTRCLKKYDSTMVTCLDCLSEAKVYSDSNAFKDSCLALKKSENQRPTSWNVALKSNDLSEKEKLKEMLKEMKDSLPKRPKPDKNKIAKNGYTFNKPQTLEEVNQNRETPTLPIGFTIPKDAKYEPQPSSSKQNGNVTILDFLNKDKASPKLEKMQRLTNNVVITQTTVLVDSTPKESLVIHNQPQPKENNLINLKPEAVAEKEAMSEKLKDTTQENTEVAADKINRKNQPMKISSLLNPIYVPKSSVVLNSPAGIENNTPAEVSKATPMTPGFSDLSPKITSTFVSSPSKLHDPPISTTKTVTTHSKDVVLTPENKKQDIALKISKTIPPTEVQENVANLKQSTDSTKNTGELPITIQEKNSVEIKTDVSTANASTSNTELLTKPSTSKLVVTAPTGTRSSASVIIRNDTPNIISTKTTNSTNVRVSSEQLNQRRDLVNQLEKSIAKGDERAAADAAVRLAQLRLSCSVLTFSSQIIAEAIPSTSTNKVNMEIQRTSPKIYETPAKSSSKVDSATQSEGTRYSKVIVSTKSREADKPIVSTKLTEADKSIVSTKSSEADKSIVSTKSTKADKPIVGFSAFSAESETPIVSPKSTEADKPIVSIKTTVTLKATNFPSNEEVDTNATAVKKSTGEASTSKGSDVEKGNLVTISVWVEDRVAARGPVRLRVSRSASLAALRRQAETSLGLPARLQRWIVGRALCCDDDALLSVLAGPDLNAPFYLCLVESDVKTEPTAEPCGVVAKPSNSSTPDDQTGQVYSELVELELRAVVPNSEPFECPVCMEGCEVGAGVVLRECVHMFCRDCLSAAVRHCEEPAVGCPAAGCAGTLQEREVRSLVPVEEYERWLARSLAAAESGTRHAFHCRTRDCVGWALCEPGVRRFPCPVCRQSNCVPCQAIHEGETCEEHRIRLREAAAATAGSQRDNEGTQTLIKSLISRGEALECPECHTIITKKWGCDWVRCSACKTEICWVTRGRRWGPQGKGDTSAGCQCGVDGKRCHPSCGYCH